jgi:hypothetical protein
MRAISPASISIGRKWSMGSPTHHQRGAKVLVALNTFMRAGTTELWKRRVDEAVTVGADALILADIALVAYAPAQSLTYFQRNRWPATTTSRLLAPVRSEPGAMPTDDCLRLHNRQRIEHFREQPIQTNEYQSVDGTEGKLLWSSSPQNVDLLP